MYPYPSHQSAKILIASWMELHCQELLQLPCFSISKTFQVLIRTFIVYYYS